MSDAYTVLAHGVGGQSDLPIPFEYALFGASWALSISFAVLGLAWKTAKFQDGEPPEIHRTWFGRAASIAGLAFTALFLHALFLRPDPFAALGTFYVLIWVGLVPIALLFGHVWRDLSPFRTVQRAVYRLAGRDLRDGWLRYPDGLGYWPAVVGIYAFVWLELVSPSASDIDAVRAWLLVYAIVTLTGGLVFGERWLDRADPFDVYSRLVSYLSPFVRGGRFVLHNPLRTLPHVPVHPGLVALVAVLLGSTAFDSYAASPGWQARGVGVLGDTLMMTAIIVVAALAFVAAAMATGGLSSAERAAMPGLMVHSLIPIAVGYVFAHYISYLLETGQETVIALFGLNAWPVYFLSDNPDLLSVLKVGFVVIGHVVAVVAAHDRALVVLPKRHRLSGQLAMLFLMVGFTVGGIYLLFDS